MKGTIRQLCKPALTVCLLLAISATAMAQRQRVTVNARGATVGEVIQSLKQQTGLDFFFSNAQVDVNRSVTIEMANAELDAVIGRLFGTGFVAEYDGNVVIIRPAAQQQQGQQRTAPVVTGRITDIKGEPIPGASVVVKGNSRIGTASDANGNYSLTIADMENATIQVSFIGMKTQEFAAGRGGVHNVILEEEANQITPVTVTVSTGYQDIPRDRMTGSYSVVTAKDLETQNFMSIDEALKGMVAGLNVMTPSGQPGTQAQMRIRGDNSITGLKEPLWVVDGLPLQQGVATINGLTSGDLQGSILNHGVGNISPQDIESVTILKDAAATAIYGARAAAGVIVVKTKRGRSGEVSVNYRGNFALGAAPDHTIDFMNSAEKVAYEIGVAEQFGNSTNNMGRAAQLWNSHQKGYITDSEYQNALDALRSTNTDWFDEIYRTSFSHSHDLSMSGGSDRAWYYASVSARDEKGILKTNRYNSFSGSLKAGYKALDNLVANLSIDASYRETNNHNSAIDPFRYAVFANTYEKPYNEDGSYAWDATYVPGSFSQLHDGRQFEKFNLLNELENTSDKGIASDITATLSLEWFVAPGLKVEAFGRVGYATSLTERYADINTYSSWINYALPMMFQNSNNTNGEMPEEYNRGYMTGSTGRSISFSGRVGVSYSRDFNDRHFINAYAGTEVRSGESWSNSFGTTGYDHKYFFVSNPQFGWAPTGDARSIINSLASMSGYAYGGKDRYASFFAALTYSYEDRYVFNTNLRFDGKGTISKEGRYSPFWSASVRWNLHNESFMRDNVPWLSELALRGVFGYTGQFDSTALPFAWMRLGSQRYDNEYIAGTTYFANPALKWERKMDRSIGLDYSLFNNVFGGSVNYYNNKTHNLLTNTTVADSFGNTSPRMNKGSLINRGLEFNFNLRLSFGDVRWLTSFNISRNTNRITETFRKSPYEADLWGGFTDNIQGYATGTVFGYRFAGVNPETGNAMIHISDRARQALVESGNYNFFNETPLVWDTGTEPKEYDGAALRDFLQMSLAAIGNTNPKYYGGFSTSVLWKGFELRTSFTYDTGRIMPTFDERRSGSSEIAAGRLNRLATAADRWRAPGDVTDIVRYTTDPNSYYQQMVTDDRWEKGDYLNWADLSLSYNVDSRVLKNLGIDMLRVGLQMQNIHTWTNYSGFDATTGGPFSYPRMRRYLLNLSLSF